MQVKEYALYKGEELLVRMEGDWLNYEIQSNRILRQHGRQ